MCGLIIMDSQLEKIFGKPNEGIHSYRDPILGLAVVDVALTVAGAALTKRLIFKETPFSTHLLVWFGTGFIVHMALGVKTKGVKMVTGSD